MLTTTATPDLANGVTVVSLRGRLALESAPSVRTTLLKCFAEAPEAVLVDVSDLRVDRASQLAIFPAALRAGGRESTVLSLFGASPELTDRAHGGVLGPVRLYATWEDAVAAVDAGPPTGTRRQRLSLPADPSAPARARALVTLACDSWGVAHLSGPATQVVSELVSNAVQHAGPGDVHLAVALRGDYLHLSVRDHSERAAVSAERPDPIAVRGRGLYLVDVYSTSWGSNPSSGGKTIWATLRATPIGAGRESGARRNA
jgi:anti-sigma regulatory factor (Ser/Thr protein kinase)/anti-anti-sigma regulatory factor